MSEYKGYGVQAGKGWGSYLPQAESMSLEDSTRLAGGNGGSGRGRLLEAADELFADYGVNEVTIAQILEGSGVKAPTLYHHFGGKEGLYITWATKKLSSVRACITQLQNERLPLNDFLNRAAKCLVKDSGIDLSQVLRDRRWLTRQESADQIDLAIEAAVVDPISKVIKEYAPRVKERCAAQVFIHLVTGTRGRYRLKGLDSEPCVENTVELFVNGVLNPLQVADPLR